MMQRLKQWLQREPGSGDAPDALRVLMVCTGNICRSPTAVGVLRAKLATAGLQDRVTVDSAGTHGYHTSEPPDRRAIEHAARRGYDISGLRARPVKPHDFLQNHWLLAMDGDHLDWLNKRAPQGHSARIELLMPYASRFADKREVPDPYYGPPAGFDQVLDLVEDACDGFVRRLLAEPDLLVIRTQT